MLRINSPREPRRQPVLAWSWHRVLQYRVFEGVVEHFFNVLSPCSPCLDKNSSALTLSLSSTFVDKNEQAKDMISPFRMPSFLEGGDPHSLCPFRELKDYLEREERVTKDHLFYILEPRNSLIQRSLTHLLCRIVKKTNPCHAPRAHNIREIVAWLVFLCTHSVERVQNLGVGH